MANKGWMLEIYPEEWKKILKKNKVYIRELGRNIDFNYNEKTVRRALHDKKASIGLVIAFSQLFNVPTDLISELTIERRNHHG